MLREFKRIFDARHDFNDSDLEILQDRYPAVEFIDIPAAWIIAIDEMLCGMRYHNPVVTVRQAFGQLVVEFSRSPEMQEFIDRYQPYVAVAERKVYEADRDLYEQFGIDPGEED